MKKITLMAALLVAFGMNAQIYSENFDAGLGDWTNVQNTGDAPWKAATEAFPNMTSSPWGPGPLQYSTGIALIDDDADGPNADNASLLSPVINLAAATNATLSFDYFNVQLSIITSVTVEVFDGTTWQEVFYIEGDAADDTAPTADGMFLQSGDIDLTPYVNGNFQIRYTYDDGGDWSFGAAIDNVVIDGTLSTVDSNINGFNYFYSPQTKNLTLTANDAFSNITIFNVLGQEVVAQKLSATNEVINLSSLKNGVYLANVTANGQTTTVKIVKR